MSRRFTILPYWFCETLLLMAVVVPVAHVRSFGERLLASPPPIAPDEPWFILMRSLLLVVAFQGAFALRDLYRWSVMMRPQAVVERLIEATIIMLIGLPLLHYILGEVDSAVGMAGVLRRLQIHPLVVMGCAGAGFLAAYGLRMRWPRWVRSRFAERIAIAGHGPSVDVLHAEIVRRRIPGIELVGFFDDTDRRADQRHILGPPESMAELAAELGLHRIILQHHLPVPDEVLLAVRLGGTSIVDDAAFYEQLTGRIAVERLSSPDLFVTMGAGASLLGQIAKRLVDIVLAIAGLVLALPICALLIPLIKLDSRGPALYTQRRVGAGGHEFTIAKFRSMQADAESGSGPVWASAGDDRITRVGRWLRKLRMDEIPQLWSVLRNDMSLVGPRPERPYFVSELTGDIPHYGQRHIVKPGVTGWAQINYTYGNTDDDALIKLQYDLFYVKNRSFALDAAILLRTVKVVVLQQGAV